MFLAEGLKECGVHSNIFIISLSDNTFVEKLNADKMLFVCVCL